MMTRWIVKIVLWSTFEHRISVAPSGATEESSKSGRSMFMCSKERGL